MISLILFTLAAILSAVMDTLAHHYSQSIFHKWHNRFWSMDLSNAQPYYLPLTKYKVDAWHVSKSLLVILLTLAIMVYQKHYAWYIELPIAGVVWNLVFNLFYNKLLLK